jgi:hypothetical protein
MPPRASETGERDASMRCQAARWWFLSSACDAEWALPDARWEKHRPPHAGGVGAGAQVSLEARVLFGGCEGGPPGRTAVDSAPSQPAGARVVRAPLCRIGVEGPTLTQDAREASSARVEPNQQTPLYGDAGGLKRGADELQRKSRLLGDGAGSASGALLPSCWCTRV